MTIPKSQKGFTLIELLVVIAIISILSTIGIASFQGAQRSARDAQRKNDLKVLQQALTEWRIDNPNTAYPANTTAWNTFLNNTLRPNYLKGQTIQDPRNAAPYQYTYVYNGATSDTYILRACLENPNDAQGIAVATGECVNGSGRKFELGTP